MTARAFDRVLVANRGEIARRVMRTCRSMGLGTVAVFSDADAGMPFVREADVAVRIGPPPSAESYLRIDRIVDAARRAGAGAVHPGYGFLAENAAFASAVEEAGLVFIGPTPDAIRAMGSKREAKRIAAGAGVPVIPGYDGSDQDPAVLAQKAIEVGFPVLLKASAGGGGIGMRIVREAGALPEAIAHARRVAEASFGDGTLLVERYVERPRHVEIQVLGDAHGNVLHLFERECSIQRRHQKLVEETPSPAVDDALRGRMCDAAVRLARAIGYRSAGTVEMILAADGSFYFLEVNTRLQVEHPVTELVTGIDIVREQIRIARGEPLALRQEDVGRRGAAIEVRLYAEDPAAGFLPQAGRLADFHVPALEGVRVDAGVESGTDVSIHYDPLLAKVIAHGADRPEAIARLRSALRGLSALGVKTNRELLLRILEHPDFAAGRTDTHFIETHGAALEASPGASLRRAALAAALAAHEARRAGALLPHVPSGWRNNPFAPQRVDYDGPTGPVQVTYIHRGGAFDVEAAGERSRVTSVAREGRTLRFEEDGVVRSARVVLDGADAWVHLAGGDVHLVERPRFPERTVAVAPGACVAPMPGKVVEVRVAEGDRVTAGQVIAVLEAMKMQHPVTAPEDGVVHALHVAPGDQVDGDALLAVVSPSIPL